MKKHFITAMAALCILASGTSAAQSRPVGSVKYGETGLALSVGYLHSSYSHKGRFDEQTRRDKGLNGLYIGMTKDFTLIRDLLSFQTGAIYEYQASNSRESFGPFRIVTDRNEHYLDIPLRLKAGFDIVPDIRAFAYVGPTIDFGLSSTIKSRTRFDDEKIGKYVYNCYSGKVSESSIEGFVPASVPESGYRRLDVLMGGAVGVELYDIAEVKFGLDWGMVNKNKNKDVADALRTHRNLFYIGVGVRF